MLEVYYTKSFVKQVKVLPKELQEEVIEKIELFKNIENHKILKVHKLHGRIKDRYSFSVNYKFRIIFVWKDKTTAILLVIGDHSIYQ